MLQANLELPRALLGNANVDYRAVAVQLQRFTTHQTLV